MTADLDVAARAVRAGADAALQAAREGRLAVETKLSAADLVSRADTAAEQAIANILGAERPDDGLLGEEGARATAKGTRRRWVVDGIDGTFNFLSGIPHWCVAIGLEDDGEPTTAAVYDPSASELFLAAPGHPTTVNDTPARVRTGRTLEQAGVATYLREDKSKDRETWLARLVDHTGVVRAGGAGTLELAWVAAGRVDAWAQPNVSAWDWVPGAALVRHAGGVATVLDGDPVWHVAGPRGLVAELAALVPRER
jgi:fructose-1,6-bisphosphatase/inositol monophosphatase family enzyme